MIRISRKEKGFTLIELLIVVAIIGILAAIAIPNLLTAMQRAKQKRTMTDIRGIGTAWEARATDANAYNGAAFSIPGDNGVTWTDLEYTQLKDHLTPTYIRTLPDRDGWSNNMEYYIDAADLPADIAGGDPAANAYALRSMGRDGTAEGDDVAGGPTTDFSCDIVFSNGTFVQYPEGVQQ